jgi:hypothetical protein
MPLRRVTLPLLGSVALLAVAAASLLGGRNVLADASDNVGQPLLFLGETFADVWCVVAGVALLLGALVLLAPPGSWPERRRVRLLVSLAVVALLTLDHTIIMVSGYLPMFLVRMVTEGPESAAILASPGLGAQILTLAGAAALFLAARDEQALRPADATPESLDQAARATRRWALVAIEAPVLYALSRVLMALHVPGFHSAEFTDELLLAGLGLGAAACVGAVLTWGLMASWGERFPRWMIGLAGKRVPIKMAVVPALVVAMLVICASRAILVDGFAPGEQNWANQLELPLIFLPQLLWPLWSVALAKAALAYERRRHISEMLL